MYSLTGLLWTSSGGAQDSFTVLEEKDITRGLPGVLGTSGNILHILCFENHWSVYLERTKILQSFLFR